jgi:hypothetical protein
MSSEVAGFPFNMATNLSLDIKNEAIRSFSFRAVSINFCSDFLPIILIISNLTAPGRFELPSSDSKSDMLGHYTTGL